MRMALVVFSAWALTCLPLADAGAQNEVVGQPTAWRLEPIGGHLGLIGGGFEQAADGQQYSTVTWTDDVIDFVQDVTIVDFQGGILGGFGLIWINSHTNTNRLAIENYPPTPTGLAARDAKFQWYVSHGYDPLTIYTGEIQDALGAPVLYVIGVKESFISPRFTSHNSLVHIGGCYSWTLQGGFSSARAFLGYDAICTNLQSNNDTNKLYGNMAGQFGVAKRPLSLAVNDVPNLSKTGNLNTVLAPIVADTWMYAGQAIESQGTGWIKFDAPMKPEDPSGVIAGLGSIKVSNAFWAAPDKLQFTVSGKYRGDGTVDILSYNPDDFDLTGAMSEPAGIGLDGNTDPFVGPNGLYPNGDDYSLVLSSTMGGDNPAANVTSFTAIDDGAGVTVRWTVEGEHQTDRYRVERGAGWSEAFVPVTEISATGAHVYTFTDPTGSSTDIYRLVEVETTGNELRHAEEQVAAPFQIHPDRVIPNGYADSLQTALLAQFPPMSFGTEEIQPIYDWLAVIPDETFRAAIQPLENFHQARGVVTNVLTLDQIGGAEGIQPFVQFAVNYGLRYLLICGDANNYVRHDDPASYYGGFTHPGYGSQPWYDIIPMSASIPDPVGTQADGLTYFTSDYSTDALYGDVDGDSLADIAVGRLPARTPAGLTVMAAKQIAGFTQSQALDQIGIWGEFRDLSGNEGQFAQQLCDSLGDMFPSGTLRKLYNTDSSPFPYATREFLAVNALNEGRSVLVAFGTQSNRSKWAIWIDKTQGFGWWKTAPSPVLPFLIGMSCDIADVDRSEDPGFGRPLLEGALLEPDRGPYAGFGPVRGSWQHDNFAIAAMFLEFTYQHGAASAGEAAMLASREYGKRGQLFKHQALSMAFIGDPAVPIPGMVLRTTDVGEESVKRISLAPPYPNPFTGQTRIRFTLPHKAVVDLSVYDVQGRRVSQLETGQKSAGVYTYTWRGPSSGVFFIRLRAEGRTEIKKMVHVR